MKFQSRIERKSTNQRLEVWKNTDQWSPVDLPDPNEKFKSWANTERTVNFVLKVEYMRSYIEHPFGEHGAHVRSNFFLEDEVGPRRHVSVLLGEQVAKNSSVTDQCFVSESSPWRRFRRVNFFQTQQPLHRPAGIYDSLS